MVQPSSSATRSPLWLRLLGGVVLALLVGALGYAVAIGVVNFSHIGV